MTGGELKRLEPALDRSSDLAVGRGWLAANARAEKAEPTSIVVEVGYRPHIDWALYGDVWAQPFEGRVGVDLASRFRNSLDLYAGGWSGRSGQAFEVGFRKRF